MSDGYIDHPFYPISMQTGVLTIPRMEVYNLLIWRRLYQKVVFFFHREDANLPIGRQVSDLAVIFW